MKSDKLYGGGSDGNSYYFQGLTVEVVSRAPRGLSVIGKRGHKTVLLINIDWQDRTFAITCSGSSNLNISHIYMIEKALYSYALTFRFSIIQVLLPLIEALGRMQEFEVKDKLEIFPK